jgi:hypothetical protein
MFPPLRGLLRLDVPVNVDAHVAKGIKLLNLFSSSLERNRISAPLSWKRCRLMSWERLGLRFSNNLILEVYFQEENVLVSG